MHIGGGGAGHDIEVLDAHDAANLQLNEAKASLNMALSEHWAGDFKAILREITAAKSEATEKDSKLKIYVKEAQN